MMNLIGLFWLMLGIRQSVCNVLEIQGMHVFSILKNKFVSKVEPELLSSTPYKADFCC